MGPLSIPLIPSISVYKTDLTSSVNHIISSDSFCWITQDIFAVFSCVLQKFFCADRVCRTWLKTELQSGCLCHFYPSLYLSLSLCRNIWSQLDSIRAQTLPGENPCGGFAGLAHCSLSPVTKRTECNITGVSTVTATQTIPHMPTSHCLKLVQLWFPCSEPQRENILTNGSGVDFFFFY